MSQALGTKKPGPSKSSSVTAPTLLVALRSQPHSRGLLDIWCHCNPLHPRPICDHPSPRHSFPGSKPHCPSSIPCLRCPFWLLFFFFFFFLGLLLWHMEVPRLGAVLELQLPACTTTEQLRIRASSVILHHISRQHPTFNPLSGAKD